MYYSIESKSDYRDITDECSGYVWSNVKPGKYRSIVWNVLDHRQNLVANPCYIKVEAVYEAVGYAKYVDMGEEEEYPEYDSGENEIGTGEYVNMWLHPGHYQIMYADIDFGNIDVEEILYADISFTNGMSFHILSFQQHL